MIKRQLIEDNSQSVKRFKGLQQHICNNDYIHWRSKHKTALNFKELSEKYPSLKKFFKNDSFVFKSSEAQIVLAECTLRELYGIQWNLPKSKLCPTIPSRANYIHFVADLISADLTNEPLQLVRKARGNVYLPARKYTKLVKGPVIQGIDIGCGANLIYSLLFASEFNWNILAVDVTSDSLEHCKTLLENNTHIEKFIQLKLQPDKSSIFTNILEPDTIYHFSVCNPPSMIMRKLKKKSCSACDDEAYCDGGEFGFVCRMIEESILYKHNILWFSTLVSKDINVKKLKQIIANISVDRYHVITLLQGKQTRWVLAWSFYSKEDRNSLIEAASLSGEIVDTDLSTVDESAIKIHNNEETK